MNVGNLTTSQLSLNAEAGVPYYVFVDSFNADVSGEVVVNVLDGGCDSVPVLDDVIDVLDAYDSTFSLMKAALQRVQMNRELEDEEATFTLFAPNDMAFRQWMASTWGTEELNDIDTQLLEDTLRHRNNWPLFSLELLGGAVLPLCPGTFSLSTKEAYLLCQWPWSVVMLIDRPEWSGSRNERLLNAPAVCDAQALVTMVLNVMRAYVCVAALGTCAVR